jgi:hypothetical protein
LDSHQPFICSELDNILQQKKKHACVDQPAEALPVETLDSKVKKDLE